MGFTPMRGPSPRRRPRRDPGSRRGGRPEAAERGTPLPESTARDRGLADSEAPFIEGPPIHIFGRPPRDPASIESPASDEIPAPGESQERAGSALERVRGVLDRSVRPVSPPRSGALDLSRDRTYGSIEAPPALAPPESPLRRPVPGRAFEEWMLGDDEALEPVRPGLERLEEEVDAAGAGPLAGLPLGILLYVRETIAGLTALMHMLSQLPWDTLRLADAEDYREFASLMLELLRAELEDQTLSRELAGIITAPITRIIEHFRSAVRLAEEGHETRSSAEVIQSTLEILELITALEGGLQLARGLPGFARRLRQLSRLRHIRRRLLASMERMRRSESGRALWEMATDTRGSLDLDALFRGGETSGARRAGVPRSRPHPPRRIRRSPARARAFRGRAAARRSGRDSGRMRRILSAHEVPPPRGLTEDSFREWVLDRIMDDPNHPLWFLVDDETGNFRRPIRSLLEIEDPERPTRRLRVPTSGAAEMAEHIDDLTVEMGHLASRHGGDPERMALQWSWANQAEGLAEGGGVIEYRNAVDIGGVPVERSTALLMEREGFLPPGTVSRAPAHSGWSLDEWLVVAGETPGSLVWSRAGRP